MKYLKLFEHFDFGYEIPMADSLRKEMWDKFKDIIKDRLIDLDDKGFTIEMNNRNYFGSNLLVINVFISNSDGNSIFNSCKSFDVTDIKDDLISLELDIKLQKFTLHSYAIQSSSDFRNYKFDVKTYGGIDGIEHTLEFLGTNVNKIELVFGG